MLRAHSFILDCIVKSITYIFNDLHITHHKFSEYSWYFFCIFTFSIRRDIFLSCCSIIIISIILFHWIFFFLVFYCVIMWYMNAWYVHIAIWYFLTEYVIFWTTFIWIHLLMVNVNEKTKKKEKTVPFNISMRL